MVGSKLKFTALLVFTTIFVSLSSCGSSMPNDEVFKIVQNLVTSSYELNDIYYGTGLPYQNEKSTTEKIEGRYSPVTEESKYKTIDEIKAATDLVFTPEYANILYEVAFSGVSVDESVIYARYIENYGLLTVYRDAETIDTSRRYNFNKIKVAKKTDKFINVVIESSMSNNEIVDIELKFRNTANGWRLDSPTY